MISTSPGLGINEASLPLMAGGNLYQDLQKQMDDGWAPEDHPSPEISPRPRPSRQLADAGCSPLSPACPGGWIPTSVACEPTVCCPISSGTPSQTPPCAVSPRPRKGQGPQLVLATRVYLAHQYANLTFLIFQHHKPGDRISTEKCLLRALSFIISPVSIPLPLS